MNKIKRIKRIKKEKETEPTKLNRRLCVCVYDQCMIKAGSGNKVGGAENWVKRLWVRNVISCKGRRGKKQNKKKPIGPLKLFVDDKKNRKNRKKKMKKNDQEENK